MKPIFTLILFFNFGSSYSQDSSNYMQSEIIYGRKDGMALTMLKLSPKKQSNKRGIISVVSGNWTSSYLMTPTFIRHTSLYINAGYTMFLVMHGSQPRYSIADEVGDISRAVRFIRYHAAEYGIDSNHIGITGSSSGGHLSLLTALADDKINSKSKDAVDAVSSRVQAAAVFYPPTDFLNWGVVNSGMSKDILVRAGVAGAFDFKKFSRATGVYESIPATDLDSTARALSPVNIVTADDPPILIIHGDADPVVPLQQSQLIIKKLKEAAVPNELIIKPGAGHGWKNSEEEEKKFVEWFDKYLK